MYCISTAMETDCIVKESDSDISFPFDSNSFLVNDLSDM